MIADMPRPRLPNLHRERTRHGALVWYVRNGHGPRLRIKAAYGTPEFEAAYRAAVAGDAPHAKRAGTHSLEWLITRYRESSAWTKLAQATRNQREHIFRPILASAGREPYAAITRKAIIAGRERRKGTPSQANCFLKAMSGLFRWAVDAEFVEVDPTATVDWLAEKTDGYHTWTEEEVERFEAYWPVGTCERLALDVLLYTGLRRGDAVRLGRQHVRDGIFTIRTEKTGEEIVAPILPPLLRSIEARPPRGLTFIDKGDGTPFTKESFANWFRRRCRAAGVPGSAHGLRKAGATRAANNGASERQLMAMFGWTTGRMATLYTRKADKKRLAREAMSLLETNDPRTSIPAPSAPVRERP